MKNLGEAHEVLMPTEETDWNKKYEDEFDKIIPFVLEGRFRVLVFSLCWTA